MPKTKIDKMWETWKDFRLDDIPPMYEGAKSSALKDVSSLEKNLKMMIKDIHESGDKKKAVRLMGLYKEYVLELKLALSEM
jgi:hypothetical protein|tara:strand:+ start:1324 stop:1566 length:243 start_codon:yes stop_codon:yes gene_type:complete